MSTNLRYFVRLDGRNRPIAGSLITRTKKPVTGNWFEIFSPCCLPSTDPESVTLPTLTGGAPQYHIEIENGQLTTGDIDTGTTTSSALVTYLTTNYSSLGTYKLEGTKIVFTPTVGGSTLTIVAGA